MHRLQRGMGEERQLVDGFHCGDSVRHGLVDVALTARHGARALRCPLQLPDDIRRAEARVRALVPWDVEGRESLPRGPHVVCDDRDRIIEPHDFLHAPDGPGFGGIDAPHPAAKHGRSGECGDLHARQRHVDAVYGGAVHLLRRVQTRCGRADELEVCRRFERDVFGYRPRCGISRESPVTGPAAAGTVDHCTLLGPT